MLEVLGVHLEAMEKEELTGRSMGFLQEVFPGHFLHRGVVDAYLELVEEAGRKGITLRLASGYRSLERQLLIWNAKASGERPVLNSVAEPMALSNMSERELVFAILRWTALPGASRHHWGTDMDIWDSAAVNNGYELQLVQAEYAEGGPFYRCSCWLDEIIASAGIGFFRPYTALTRGEVAPEPWHLSYRPLAEGCAKALTLEMLQELIESIDIRLKSTILDNLEEIYSRFVVAG